MKKAISLAVTLGVAATTFALLTLRPLNSESEIQINQDLRERIDECASRGRVYHWSGRTWQCISPADANALLSTQNP